MSTDKICVSSQEQLFIFPTEELLLCVISLFEDTILTGQDEVTKSLVDWVVHYIKKPIQFHFALEQLGITWEEVSVMSESQFLFEEKSEQVRCEGNTERNITRNYWKYVLTIREGTLLFH